VNTSGATAVAEGDCLQISSKKAEGMMLFLPISRKEKLLRRLRRSAVSFLSLPWMCICRSRRGRKFISSASSRSIERENSHTHNAHAGFFADGTQVVVVGGGLFTAGFTLLTTPLDGRRAKSAATAPHALVTHTHISSLERGMPLQKTCACVDVELTHQRRRRRRKHETRIFYSRAHRLLLGG
jgi:hypothetical protein